MKDEKDGHERQAAKNAKADPRQDRLKLALRENLKRRKIQQRARAGAADRKPDGDPQGRESSSPLSEN